MSRPHTRYFGRCPFCGAEMQLYWDYSLDEPVLRFGNHNHPVSGKFCHRGKGLPAAKHVTAVRTSAKSTPLRERITGLPQSSATA